MKLIEVIEMMLKSPAILTIAAIEFFSGYLRNSILQYYRTFAEETGRAATAQNSYTFCGMMWSGCPAARRAATARCAGAG